METSQFTKKIVPVPPPLPKLSFHRTRLSENGILCKGVCLASSAVNKTWDTLFDEGYRADVLITTDGNDIIYAHSCILGIASPVFENILKQSRNHSRRRPQIISICGVSANAVRMFIRFLYSSRYEEDQLKEHAVQVLALAHAYAIPSLKLLCELKIEQGMLTVENVVDIFQLAMLFDAARLSAICYHFILNNFKDVSATEGWRVMKDTHPILENKIQISLLHENSVKKQRQKKMEERKIYKQLHEAMEAVVHFFRDGCGTTGSQYRIIKGDKSHCPYDICKILESLILHFRRCKKRVTGGDCINCNRICGILELHSRICANPNLCRVPLCRKFRNRRNGENTKESVKWKILAGKIVRSKSISGAPFFSLEST